MTSPERVALIPYDMRPRRGLHRLKLAELTWLTGAPEFDDTACVSDLGPRDHLVTYPYSALHFLPWGKIRCKVSLLIAEPDAIHAKHIFFLRVTNRRFHRILTRSVTVLQRHSNARLFVTGATHVTDPDMTYPQKSRSTSLIASAKRDQEGHILRHALVDLIRQERREVDILGRGYAPFEQKQDGLAPYRYSIVIENAQEPSYFTEKLIDAYICRTVPIYWGAPDIGRWFDTSGMIICDSLEELFQALERCSEQDYADRRAAIDRNAALARRYADTFSRAVDVLLSDQGETPPFG